MALSKSQSLSKALASKIAQQKALAPDLLPKTRLCAGVVLAMAEGQGVDEALARLKGILGDNWSTVAALQFMSGKQALFCAACEVPDGQARLLRAQRIAEAVFQEAGNAKRSAAELQAMAQRLALVAPATP
jgi:hypothetical protein